ncbi:MAG: hypothetical protein QXS54_06525 [Candidatus Methanomethylicaceae archaeon]
MGSKMDEEVLVISRDLLPDLPSRGLVLADETFLASLLPRAKFMSRREAESNPSYKQLIPYAMLRFADKIFRYRRSTWTREKRLHGLYSIGVGGHVVRADLPPSCENYVAVIERARDRELAEEFLVETLGHPTLVGLLNDESNEVGQVHLGIVYEYLLQNPNVKSREKRNHINCGFLSVEALASNIQEYENWSQVLIERLVMSLQKS